MTSARERYFQTGMALSAIAHDIAEKGFPVDQDARERHRVRLTRERAEAEVEFMSLTGLPFAQRGKDRVSPLRQNKVLHKLFYGTYGWEPRKEYYSKDTGELQVNKNMLQDMADESVDPIQRKVADAKLRFGKADKYLTSYIENLPVHADGRLHIQFSIMAARTMRHTAAILHQLPKALVVMNKEGKKEVKRPGLRDIMCAPPGYTILEFDQSQQELRLIALFTGDKPLMDGYARGMDVHRENAKILLGGDGTGLGRELAKTGVFAFCYGGDAHAAWKQMTPKFPGLKKKLVQMMESNWWVGHPTIKAYQEEQVRLARRVGYIVCPISGLRIEYHPAGGGVFRVDRTKVINTRIQHSGMDMMNPGTVAANAVLKPSAWICCLLHDAVFVMSRDEDVPFHVENVQKAMYHEIEYEGRTMRFPVEVKFGKNWGQLVDYVH